MLYRLLALMSLARTHVRIKVMQKRLAWIHLLGRRFSFKKKKERLLIVVPHVVSGLPLADISEKLARIGACLDGILDSFASYNKKIILLSKSGFSLHENLPHYQKSAVEVVYSNQEDPMNVEFDAFEVFKERKDLFDLFLFLEDDLIIHDSWMLEKLALFKEMYPDPSYLLVPHRYEFYEGRKYYLDQMVEHEEKTERYKIIESMSVELNGVKLCTYENPHAAFYCLNQTQLQRWIDSKYQWKNKIVAFGHLESAATYGLFENFTFLKPHPDHANFLEIQHHGNKYITQDKIKKDAQ